EAPEQIEIRILAGFECAPATGRRQTRGVLFEALQTFAPFCFRSTEGGAEVGAHLRHVLRPEGRVGAEGTEVLQGHREEPFRTSAEWPSPGRMGPGLQTDGFDGLAANRTDRVVIDEGGLAALPEKGLDTREVIGGSHRRRGG